MRILVLAAVLAVPGCSTRWNEPGPSRPDLRPSAAMASDQGRHDLILGDELLQARGPSAADAIRQLRPHFLCTPPMAGPSAKPEASVYINGSYVGRFDVLEIVGLRSVKEVRHLTPMAARSLYGSYCRCEGGVIDVVLERRGTPD